MISEALKINCTLTELNLFGDRKKKRNKESKEIKEGEKLLGK